MFEKENLFGKKKTGCCFVSGGLSDRHLHSFWIKAMKN
jgi:hypothetical protein